MSYIFLYLEDSPIYSYIWKTVLYIPIFQGKQEMLNSYLKKKVLFISIVERCRLDHYWRNISMKIKDGKIKCKCLPELVKSVLILPHGNADVERSLSVNTSVVTEDRPHIGEESEQSRMQKRSSVQSVINLKKFPHKRAP